MKKKYITVKDKQQRPEHRDTFYRDCAVFGACGIGIYIVTCAVLILGRLV